jgi:hypothetical protein
MSIAQGRLATSIGIHANKNGKRPVPQWNPETQLSTSRLAIGYAAWYCNFAGSENGQTGAFHMVCGVLDKCVFADGGAN